MVTLICPTCGINKVQVDMTEEEARGLPFEQIPDCLSCSMSEDEIPQELKSIHTGLLEAAEKRMEICRYGFVVNCPQCHERQFSAFDKIFCFAFQRCIDCTPANEVDAYSDAVFQIAGGL